MKAVIYHATANGSHDYEALFRGFVANAHEHGIKVVHLTTYGEPAWGDETYFWGLDRRNIVYNREIVFYQYLSRADPEEVYWFTEPDARIKNDIPPLTCDLALLYREGDSVPITPSFRLARKSALPFFKETYELTLKLETGLDWHGDSGVFNEMHARMGQPKVGKIEYNGMQIELRTYNDYNAHGHSGIVQHFKAHNKRDLILRERAA